MDIITNTRHRSAAITNHKTTRKQKRSKVGSIIILTIAVFKSIHPFIQDKFQQDDNMNGGSSSFEMEDYSHQKPIKKQLISDRTKFHATLLVCFALVVALIATKVQQDDDNGSTHKKKKKNTIIMNSITNSLDRDIDPYWRLRPTDLHIVMMGDAITHYQYLSLAYWLRTGRWFDPTIKKSHLTSPYSYQNIWHDEVFGEFFFQTTRLLQPHEICDCIYPHHSDPFRENQNSFAVINRYFHDPDRNNTLRFFYTAVNHTTPETTTISLQGRLTPTNITALDSFATNQQIEHDSLLNGKHQFHPRDILWHTNSWADVLRDHISQLLPKPQFVVLNGPPSTLLELEANSKELSYLQTILQEELGIVQTFWRTTTYKRNHMPVYVSSASPLSLNEPTQDDDQKLCDKFGWQCLDISWTRDLNEKLYWDEIHNKEPVYRIINEDLLETIGYLPNGYQKFDRTILLN